MARFRGLLFTVLCCSVVVEVCCITVEEFYTFGQGSGDTRLSRNDDGSSEVITLRTEFPFFDQIRRRVYVSTLLHYSAITLRGFQFCLIVDRVVRGFSIRARQLRPVLKEGP